MQEKKKGRPLYALLIEHREIPLLAVLVLLLILVSIRVPGYLADNYMNVLKGGSINMVMGLRHALRAFGRLHRHLRHRHPRLCRRRMR